MKNIDSYVAEKYNKAGYLRIEEGIYKTKDPYGGNKPGDIYVTSLSFQQEEEFGEGATPKYISQMPLECLLDEFLVYVTDFYEELNANSPAVCYQEFGSPEIEDLRKLRSVIGKHVYMRVDPSREDEDGGIYEEFVVE